MDFYAIAHLTVGLLVGLGLVFLALAVEHLATAVTGRSSDKGNRP